MRSLGLGRFRRIATLGAVTIGHAVILLAIILTIGSASKQQRGSPTTFALAATTAEPAVASREIEEQPAIGKLGPEADRASGLSSPKSASAEGAACDPLEALPAIFSTDLVAREALAGASIDKFSVDDALVIWSTRWHERAHLPDGELATLRLLIEQAIGSLPEACLNEAVTGPRFLVIERDEGEVTLVFGSGDWTWAQMLDAEQPDQDETLLDEIFSGIQDGL